MANRFGYKYFDLKGTTSEYKAKLFLEKQFGIQVVETNHFSNLDMWGYDLIGMVGETVVLIAQVKSSEEAAKAFMAYRNFDPRISVIVAPDGAAPYFFHRGQILV